jgi:2-polyprenyl-3-methyl-5-hydroxy-6-metoxy-1,4-benzoquinol methylase
MNSLYERYHLKPKLQKRIISENNFTYRNIFGLFKKYLKSSMTVLDIGCGTGTIDLYLASKGFRVTGIDISVKAIDMAIKNAKNLGQSSRTQFMVSEFPKTRIVQKYDAVICTEVLEHLKNDGDAVKFIFNLLKSGGIAIFSSPSTNSTLYRMKLTKKHDNDVGHLRRYAASAFTQMIKDAGFQIKVVKKIQSIFREAIFIFPVFGILVRIANKIGFASDLFTGLDNLFLPLGESDIIVVAKKI